MTRRARRWGAGIALALGLMMAGGPALAQEGEWPALPLSPTICAGVARAAFMDAGRAVVPAPATLHPGMPPVSEVQTMETRPGPSTQVIRHWPLCVS